ncbi:penicillin acylase family protein [Imhoffiella purpurea]|uniref:Family S45 unassigned peptidase n=1 Tax=Imhoffiella purpurea TaxID=1249627 RepID=W9V6B0_9GAMM|nr:penicillin acylase family protein [Imhoffiella purpurea]EXJ14904.1 Family S45 unassigned peptidase [Imhoffiella purpurea]
MPQPSPRRIRNRRFTRILGGILLTTVAAIGGALFWIGASLPPIDGEERLSGLQAEVALERDARGRLGIRAADREDLLFGLGYAHAQDRYFQMDLLRRAGSGTLAELIGPAAVEVDRVARLHDLAGTARASLARLAPEERAQLDTYVRGVNAGLASLGARPWEYLLLRQPPAPWTPVDSLHAVLAMYRDLQEESNRAERALDLASRTLDPRVFALFRVSPGPWEAPIEGEAGSWPQVEIPVSGPGLRTTRSEPPSIPDPMPAGSNAFAVGGALTADGRALIANDMHLTLRVPNVWYPVRLRHGGETPLDAVGVSLPGAPALVVGSNGHIAWGLTNSYGDWLDHVVLELDPSDPNRYLTPDGWRRLERRTEWIRVAGEDPVRLEIQQSLWGPLVGHDPEGRPLALRWVAQEPEALNLRLMRMVDQTSAEAALRLAPTCGVPAQNILVASADGEVGWTILGRVPRRRGLDGPRPRSWADGRTGWLGWLEPNEVPRIGPSREARLWTANARVVDLHAQSLLGDGRYNLGARARRIRDRLMERLLFDEPALLDIQLDDRAELMEGWYRRLVALVQARKESPERTRILRLLADWDGRASIGSVAYRLTREWRTRVSSVVLDALNRPLTRLSNAVRLADLPRTEIAVWSILRDPPAWVPPGYDGWSELQNRCLDQVLERWGAPEDWPSHTWGARNTTAIRHPFSPLLPSWIGAWLDLPPRPVPGDSNVTRVSNPTQGASERLVVAPGAESRGILQLPGGANAHPFSGTREGDYREWLSGEPVPLLPGPARHRRILRPAASGP